MNILEKIIANKYKEVDERKSICPVKLMERSIYFNSQTVSLKKYLLRDDKSGIIAEFKRKSPSKGFINKYASVEKTSIGYMQAGASALSILTDTAFFGGSDRDLTEARKYNYCPILRKDFIVDEYQIIETKSIGADAILLLANVLSKEKIKEFSILAKTLGLEVLLEIRELEDLNVLNENITAVGVNNRDLKSFETNVSRSFELAKHIPLDFIKVSESGINSSETILKLKENNFRGFLIGELFMKNSSPEQACQTLIKEMNGSITI